MPPPAPDRLKVVSSKYLAWADVRDAHPGTNLGFGIERRAEPFPAK